MSRWYHLDYDNERQAWKECHDEKALAYRQKHAEKEEQVFFYDGEVYAAAVLAATLNEAVAKASDLVEKHLREC